MKATPNRENIQKWVTWLRDPGHHQTTQRLRNGDSFCCLGGVCEVFRNETGKGMWSGGQREKSFLLDGKESRHYPPAEVMEWLGFESVPAGNDPLIQENVLASIANDEQRWSFLAIAQAIEDLYLKGEEK